MCTGIFITFDHDHRLTLAAADAHSSHWIVNSFDLFSHSYATFKRAQLTVSRLDIHWCISSNPNAAEFSSEHWVARRCALRSTLMHPSKEEVVYSKIPTQLLLPSLLEPAEGTDHKPEKKKKSVA